MKVLSNFSGKSESGSGPEERLELLHRPRAVHLRRQRRLPLRDRLLLLPGQAHGEGRRRRRLRRCIIPAQDAQGGDAGLSGAPPATTAAPTTAPT